MDGIKYKDFISVYESDGNRYIVYVPTDIWDNLTKKYPRSTSNLAVRPDAHGSFVHIIGYKGDFDGADWFENIVDELYAVYADGNDLEIKHSKVEGLLP